MHITQTPHGKVHRSVASHPFPVLCDRHHYLMSTSLSPKGEALPALSLDFPASPGSGNQWATFYAGHFVQMESLCLASPAEHVFKVHPCHSVCQCFMPFMTEYLIVQVYQNSFIHLQNLVPSSSLLASVRWLAPPLLSVSWYKFSIFF